MLPLIGANLYILVLLLLAYQLANGPCVCVCPCVCVLDLTSWVVGREKVLPLHVPPTS